MLTSSYQVVSVGSFFTEEGTLIELAALPPDEMSGDNINLFDPSGKTNLRIKLKNPVAEQFFTNGKRLQVSFKAI